MASDGDGIDTARLIDAAQRALSAIGGVVAAKEDPAPIATNAGSLRGVAAVLTELTHEVRRCGGGDCMGRQVDGFKLWVTQDRLDAVQKRLFAAEAALARIVAEANDPVPDFAMLRDWHAVALRQGQIAQSALNGQLPQSLS